MTSTTPATSRKKWPTMPQFPRRATDTTACSPVGRPWRSGSRSRPTARRIRDRTSLPRVTGATLRKELHHEPTFPKPFHRELYQLDLIRMLVNWAEVPDDPHGPE